MGSVSQKHWDEPYSLELNGMSYQVKYEPSESSTGLFGGNSNWRGPIWFPLNYLLIESLQKFHHYLGDTYKVELPSGSGNYATLAEVATELSRRLTRIFLRDASRNRPVYGAQEKLQNGPHFADFVLFHEYIDGEQGT